MFDAVLDIQLGYVLCGVIWSLALGFAVGNYACSLVHRLPRGKLILDKPPYCGHCDKLLATRDLFPVFSALLLRHRCRYCQTPFPVSHTWTELLVGALFTLAFFKYNFGEQFLLVIILGVFLIVMAAIHANENKVLGNILLSIAVFGIFHRILQDGTIYPALQGGFFALILAAALWHKKIKKVGHIYTLPRAAEVMIVGGICAGSTLLPQYLLLYLSLYVLGLLLGKLIGKPIAYSTAFGFAVTLTALYPELIPL